MEHRDLGGESGVRCYAFFGHTQPTEGLAPGRSVTEGGPIALLSDHKIWWMHNIVGDGRVFVQPLLRIGIACNGHY